MGGDWLIPVARARSRRLLFALLQRRSGRRLRAPSGPIKSQPAPAGETAIGPTQLLSGTKAEGEKKRRGEKKKKRKAQTAATDRLGERSEAHAARRQAGLPLRLSPPGQVKRGRGWAGAKHLCLETGRVGGERMERRACCHLAGRALFWSFGDPRDERVPPYRPLHRTGTALPTPNNEKLSKQRLSNPFAKPLLISEAVSVAPCNVPQRLLEPSPRFSPSS